MSFLSAKRHKDSPFPSVVIPLGQACLFKSFPQVAFAFNQWPL
jgi:hypothetical protein